VRPAIPPVCIADKLPAAVISPETVSAPPTMVASVAARVVNRPAAGITLPIAGGLASRPGNAPAMWWSAIQPLPARITSTQAPAESTSVVALLMVSVPAGSTVNAALPPLAISQPHPAGTLAAAGKLVLAAALPVHSTTLPTSVTRSGGSGYCDLL
jgi:hypothetical protein